MQVSTKKYVDDNSGKVGTKTVDEALIGDDKILVYKTATSNLVYETKPSGGGLSWGASITGTSGTGITSTIGNSATAGTVGYSGIIGNTQTVATTLISLNGGTSAQ